MQSVSRLQSPCHCDGAGALECGSLLPLSRELARGLAFQGTDGQQAGLSESGPAAAGPRSKGLRASACTVVNRDAGNLRSVESHPTALSFRGGRRGERRGICFCEKKRRSRFLSRMRDRNDRRGNFHRFWWAAGPWDTRNDSWGLTLGGPKVHLTLSMTGTLSHQPVGLGARGPEYCQVEFDEIIYSGCARR
jgi:hypothetical protein